MKDRQLSRALRSLPRASASPEFAAQVLGRLEARHEARRRRRSRGAVAAAVLVALGGLAGWQMARQQGADAQRQALLRESSLLEREIEQLRWEIEETTPVLYVGGTEDVDFVVDLSRFEPPTAVRPAGL